MSAAITRRDVWVEVVDFADGEADGGFWGAVIDGAGRELYRTAEYDSSQGVVFAAREWAKKHGHYFMGRSPGGLQS